MKSMIASNVYNTMNGTVNCDICFKAVRGISRVYHCPNGKNLSHPNGYDICQNCAKNPVSFTKIWEIK